MNHETYRHVITLQGTNISPKNGILKMIFLFPRWDMLIPWRVCRKPSLPQFMKKSTWRFCQVNEGEGTKHGAGELSFKQFWHSPGVHSWTSCTDPRYIIPQDESLKPGIVSSFLTDFFLCKQKVQDWMFHQHYGWWYCLILLGWIEILSLRKSVFFFDSYQIISSTPAEINMESKNWWFADAFSFSKGAFLASM